MQSPIHDQDVNINSFGLLKSLGLSTLKRLKAVQKVNTRAVFSDANPIVVAAQFNHRVRPAIRLGGQAETRLNIGGNKKQNLENNIHE
jgi:hypothetical protein